MEYIDYNNLSSSAKTEFILNKANQKIIEQVLTSYTPFNERKGMWYSKLHKLYDATEHLTQQYTSKDLEQKKLNELRSLELDNATNLQSLNDRLAKLIDSDKLLNSLDNPIFSEVDKLFCIIPIASKVIQEAKFPTLTFKFNIKTCKFSQKVDHTSQILRVATSLTQIEGHIETTVKLVLSLKSAINLALESSDETVDSPNI